MAVPSLGCHTKSPSVSPGPPGDARLANAAPTVDALLDEFLAALEGKDMQALERLRVSESEYRDIIMPGSVPPGHAPQVFPEKKSKFFWGMNNTKSIYWAGSLLESFGGHRYTRKEVEYTKGVQQYAWYTAYKRVRLTVVDEEGNEKDLRTGSIAEVNGQYKFVSFAGG